MSINLQKLRALEMPSKKIFAEVLGEKQEITIQAYGYDVSLKISDMRVNFPEDGEYRIWVMLLTECAGLSVEDAELYIQKDGNGAANVIREINALCREYDVQCSNLRKDAKKKYETAT